MTFTFGIFDSFDLGTSTPGQVLTDRLDFAVAAEAAGIGHYHATEHHGTPLSVCPSPNLFLAALSQRTTSMRMGALVNVLPAHEPLRLAEEICVLDQMTGGRLDLGVGRGVSPYEMAYFGVDPERQAAIYDESLEVILQGLRTGRIQHQGKELRDYDLELSVRPVQTPHPPLWYASPNKSTAEWAGANGVNLIGRWNSGGFTEAARAYWRNWEEAGRPGGTPPSIGVSCKIVIGRTDAAGLARFRQANDVFNRHLTKIWHEHGDHRVDGTADTEGTLASGNAIAGSAATVRDRLVEQIGAAPLNYLEVSIGIGDLSAEEARANLDAFAEVVMPAVREAAARRGGVPA